MKKVKMILAKNTGCKIVGSTESSYVLKENVGSVMCSHMWTCTDYNTDSKY